MSNTARLSGSPRLASPDLPPTLLPNPITMAAREPSKGVSLLGAILLYSLCGGAVMAVPKSVAHVTPPKTGPVFTFRDPVDIPTPPTLPPVAQPQRPMSDHTGIRPKDWVPPSTSDIPSDDVPSTLPTRDHALDSLYDVTMRVARDGETPTPRASALTGSPQPTAPPPPRVMETSFDNLRILSRGSVNYPPIARLARVQGEVVMQVLIDAQGIPQSVQVVSGPEQLRAEAMRSALTWRFEPARMDGVPVMARFHLTLQFRLQ